MLTFFSFELLFHSTSSFLPSTTATTCQAFVSLRLDLFRPALSTLIECLRSEPGSEPKKPYQVLKDGKPFLEERVVKVQK